MSSGFICESEILEARRRRQEEWEKVRTDDQPQEAPEEDYDSRPLYQRLEEQRLRKEAEYEEAHKLKNMIRGLDDDEVGFLDLVEHTKAQAAQQISLEEKKEMQEFREYKSTLAESEEIRRLKAQLAPARPTPPSGQTQKNKLQGIVVRKRKASEVEGDKQNSDVSPPKNSLNNFDEPFAELDFLPKKYKVVGLPEVKSGPRGIPGRKKNEIVAKLVPLMPESRRTFWYQMPVNDESIDFQTEGEMAEET